MSPVRMSRVESPMRIALDYYAGIRQQDADGILRLIGDECIFETSEPAPDGTVCAGKEVIASYLNELLAVTSQYRFEIEDIYGVGKRCVVFWRYEGDGIRGVDLFQVNDDLIQEIRSYIKGSWLLD